MEIATSAYLNAASRQYKNKEYIENRLLLCVFMCGLNNTFKNYAFMTKTAQISG